MGIRITLCAGIVLSALVLAAADSSSVTVMHGSGTTNPSKYFWKVFDMFEERSKVPLHMTYRAVGSSTGQKEFIGTTENANTAYNHFGAGDIPLTNERYTELAVTTAEMIHVPFVLGAISFFHSIPGVGNGVAGLNVTGCLLGRIFSRQITTWDHADILAVNPALLTLSPGVASANINVVHRTLGSSSTAGATEYLNTIATDADNNCPDAWPLTTGSTVNWPEDTEGAYGSDGVADAIAATEYSIGYLDSGHGQKLGFSEIELQNKDGIYLSAAEANIGAAAAVALANDVLPATGDADFSSVNLYNLPGPTTWPITMFSYFYIRKDLTALGDTGSLVKAMVEFVLSEEGQDMITEFGFEKCPAEVLAYNAASIALVSTDPNAAEFTFEGSTTEPYIGMGESVISAKRRSWAEYELGVMAGQIAELQAQIAALQAHEETEDDDTPHGHEDHDDDDDDDDDDTLAQAGLGIGVVALVLAIAALSMAMTKRGAPAAKEQPAGVALSSA